MTAPNAFLYESPLVRAVTGPAVRPGGLELTRRAAALCGWPRGARVLDIGCGPGATVDCLRREHGLAAWGIDLSPGMLARAGRSFPPPPLAVGRAEALPAADASLKGVFLECVLSLTSDPALVLQQCRRALGPGGRLVISDIYERGGRAQSAAAGETGSCCLNRALTEGQVKRLAQSRGFAVELWEDHSGLLKSLAAKLVWECGSREKLRSLWEGSPGCGGRGVWAKENRPGYFLMIARREVKRHG